MTVTQSAIPSMTISNSNGSNSGGSKDTTQSGSSDEVTMAESNIFEEAAKEVYWQDGLQNGSTMSVSEVMDSTEEEKPSGSEDSLLFYWFDAYEDKFTQPGVVFLFGKIQSGKKNDFASCSVKVSGIEREVYLALNPGFSIEEAQQEFEELRKKWKIERYRCKPVKKTYTFDDAPNVSKEKDSTFLMVLIPASGEKKNVHFFF